MAVKGERKTKITCPCGTSVTGNTWRRHLLSKCQMSATWRQHAMEVLELRPTRPLGWLRRDEKDAVARRDWYVDVIVGNSALGDWVFESPRAVGETTRATQARHSLDRKGTNNPAIRNKIAVLDPLAIKARAIDLLKQFHAEENLPLRWVARTLRKEFPGWTALFTEGRSRKEWTSEYRGDSYENYALASVLGVSVADVIEIGRMRRGLLISRGQRSSPEGLAKMRESGSKSVSSWRVTRPQRVLFAMVKSLDPRAELEFNSGAPHFRSFDVYSPRANAVFEMHGRIWHDQDAAPEGLRALVAGNVENDALKAAIAEGLGLRLIVLWDDKTDEWAPTLRRLFHDEEPVSYEDAQNKVG